MTPWLLSAGALRLDHDGLLWLSQSDRLIDTVLLGPIDRDPGVPREHEASLARLRDEWAGLPSREDEWAERRAEFSRSRGVATRRA